MVSSSGLSVGFCGCVYVRLCVDVCVCWYRELSRLAERPPASSSLLLEDGDSVCHFCQHVRLTGLGCFCSTGKCMEVQLQRAWMHTTKHMKHADTHMHTHAEMVVHTHLGSRQKRVFQSPRPAGWGWQEASAPFYPGRRCALSSSPPPPEEGRTSRSLVHLVPHNSWYKTSSSVSRHGSLCVCTCSAGR